MRLFLLSLFASLIIVNAHATITELSPKETRFVATRANKVNARSGPHTRYPIVWIYQQQNYPLEIIAEYEQWRKVRDYEGTTTWIKKNLLTNTRYALIIEDGENNIYAKDTTDSPIIARVENGVVAKIKKCSKTFCLLEFENKLTGWVERSAIYGLKPNEEI